MLDEHLKGGALRAIGDGRVLDAVADQLQQRREELIKGGVSKRRLHYLSCQKRDNK